MAEHRSKRPGAPAAARPPARLQARPALCPGRLLRRNTPFSDQVS